MGVNVDSFPSHLHEAIPIELAREALVISMPKILGQYLLEFLLAENYQVFFFSFESYNGFVGLILHKITCTLRIRRSFLMNGETFFLGL